MFNKAYSNNDSPPSCDQNRDPNSDTTLADNRVCGEFPGYSLIKTRNGGRSKQGEKDIQEGVGNEVHGRNDAVSRTHFKMLGFFLLAYPQQGEMDSRTSA